MTVMHSCGQDGGKVHNFIGQQSAGNLVFSESGAPKFQFPKPDPLTVYRNELAALPVSPDELTKCLARGVAAKLGGAFVRTNLLVNTNWMRVNRLNSTSIIRSSDTRSFSTSLASMVWLTRSVLTTRASKAATSPFRLRPPCPSRFQGRLSESLHCRVDTDIGWLLADF